MCTPLLKRIQEPFVHMIRSSYFSKLSSSMFAASVELNAKLCNSLSCPLCDEEHHKAVEH